MKIRNYDAAMEDVENNRDEMLAFIASQEPGSTPQSVFAKLAGDRPPGLMPDEHLYLKWCYYQDQAQRRRQIAEALVELKSGGAGGDLPESISNERSHSLRGGQTV